MKLQEFYLIHFLGNSHFEDDTTENYLLFLPYLNIFKKDC